MSEQPSIFADTVQEANIAHGVARLRLGQVAAGGALVPSGTLLVPVSQLPVLARAVTSVIQQLEQRARQADADAAAPAVGDAPDAGPA